MLFLLTAKARQRDMKDLLCDVDSEGSTLLHLAVESGNSEVKNLLKTIPFICSKAVRPRLIDFNRFCC